MKNIDVVKWVAEVIHRGVQHLDVENEVCPRGRDIMPKCVYVSKTLVSLKLVMVGLEDPKFVFSLPCLKIIYLETNYYTSGDSLCIMDFTSGDGLLIMEKLISGSPVLENITMEFGTYGPKATLGVNSFWTNVPQCLSSTKYIKINKEIMREETGIKLVNYFLENSAVLKKLTLSCRDSYMTKTNQEAQSYKKLLTSTKLSPRCQIVVY